MRDDYDLGWRQRAANLWDPDTTIVARPSDARPLSIFGGLLSIVPRVVCVLRNHRRGVLSIDDGRIIEVRNTTLALRCRFCGSLSPGWTMHQ